MVPLEERIEEAFTMYGSTIELLKEFIASRRNPQEFILLACARLDSLSNLAFTGKPQKDCFVSFLARHSGLKRNAYQISLPDLCDFLCYHLWVLPGTIDKPGRLHMFDPREDERFMSFLWNSGLAITQEEVGRLLMFLIRAIKKKYRVFPTQSKQKQSSDKPDNLYNYLYNAAQQYRRGIYLDAIKGISSLLKDFSFGALLYRKYRNGIIHEFGVGIHEQDFFTKNAIHWRTTYHTYVEPTKFLQIQFPARFLLEILTHSVQSYIRELKNTRLLPMAVFNETCDFLEEIKHLDDRSIPVGKDISILLR